MGIEKYGVTAAEAVSLFGTGVVLGGLAVRSYLKSPLNDEGHRVYITPDFEALNVIVDVCTASGLEPAYEIADEKTVQAVMKDNNTTFLVPRTDVWEEMGRPSGAPMLRVKKPYEAAEKAQTILAENGYESDILTNMDDQIDGEMVFVKTNALACGLIGFRQHVAKMGPKPPKWKQGKKLGFTGPKDV